MLDSEALSEDDSRNYRGEITRTSLKAYEKAFLHHYNDIKSFCAARNVGVMTVCSDESLEEMLFKKATEVGLIR
jgi:hypothetical protein